MAARLAARRPALWAAWLQPAGVWLFVLALAHGSLYAALTPPWQAPDEIAHFEYAWLLGRLRHPLWNENASPELERAIIQSLYEFHAWDYMGLTAPAVPPERLADAPFYGLSRTLTRFSLSYVLYAAVGPAFGGAGLLAELYAMRAVSVILGALVVVLTYQLARLAQPASPALAWGSALFVLLLPQHTFLAGAVSDGPLAEVLATVCLYGAVRAWRHGLTWPWLVVIGVSGVGALAAKTTALYLVPLLAIGAVTLTRRWYTSPGRTGRERRWAVAGALLGALALALGGWLALGLIEKLSSPLESVTATLQDTLGQPGAWAAYVWQLFTSGDFTAAWARTLESAWAYFGWMVVRQPPAWRLLPGILLALALGGWAWRGIRRRGPAPASETGALAPLALAAALAVLILLAWFLSTPVGLAYSQGRYLFGAIAPIAVLLMAGWLSWRPARDHGWLLLALAAVWVIGDAAALLGVLVPYFYRLS